MKEQGYNVRLSNMFALRKAAYRQQTGHDLETNIEKVMRFWGDTVKFSPHDLTYGTFIPERVDPVVAFLLGIYRAKANVKREDFTISIAGAKGSKLYEDLVIPLIDDLFEIDAYKSDEAVIDVTSRAHFSWLELIGFQRNDFPRWEKIPLKNRTRDQSLLDRAYFMGMFAALMNPQRYENEYPYGWQSQERSAEFEIAGRKAGYRIVHNANGAFLTRDETVKLMQQLGLRGLKVEHIGGIYNPEHIRFMCEDFVRSQYLFVPKPK
jgi:hypothetical protein